MQLHLFGNQTQRSAPGSLLIIDSRRTRLGQKKTISDGTFDLCRTGKTSFARVVCIVVYRGRMTAAQFRVHFAISPLCWSQAPKPWMRRCEDVAIRAVNVCQRASEDPSRVFADCYCGQARPRDNVKSMTHLTFSSDRLQTGSYCCGRTSLSTRQHAVRHVRCRFLSLHPSNRTGIFIIYHRPPLPYAIVIDAVCIMNTFIRQIGRNRHRYRYYTGRYN